jgi:hypothetical protein
VACVQNLAILASSERGEARRKGTATANAADVADAGMPLNPYREKVRRGHSRYYRTMRALPTLGMAGPLCWSLAGGRRGETHWKSRTPLRLLLQMQTIESLRSSGSLKELLHPPPIVGCINFGGTSNTGGPILKNSVLIAFVVREATTVGRQIKFGSMIFL